MAQIIADLSTLQNVVRPPVSVPSTSISSSTTPTPVSITPPPTSRSCPPNANAVSHPSPLHQEPVAAQNLLNANKDLSPKTLRRKSKASLLPEPPKFDKLGRRIIRASSYNGSMTPTRPDMFGRIGSNISNSSSGVATPNVQTSTEEVRFASFSFIFVKKF